MPTNLLEIQRYDVATGLKFVVGWVLVVFVLVLALGVRSQYRLMNSYDILTSRNSSRQQKARTIVTYVKRLTFSLLGYQGEERERQTLDQLHADWILTNFGKIFFRFAIFYFVYIWALILTTRALLIDSENGQIQLLTYTSKQIFGFFMIAIYIASNSVFDILSGLHPVLLTPA
jgi:hypothetical protein